MKQRTKFFALLAGFFMLLTGNAMAQSSGDVNEDGVVNEQDITAIIDIMESAEGVSGNQYFWYCGQTKPESMNEYPIVDDTDFTAGKWHTLTGNFIRKTITGGTAGNYWYWAVPTNRIFVKNQFITNGEVEGTISIKNESYTIWKSEHTNSRCNVGMDSQKGIDEYDLVGDVNKDDAVDVADILSTATSIMIEDEDENTKYYWYAGQTKPVSMTSEPTLQDVGDGKNMNNNWHPLDGNATTLSETVFGGTSGDAWYVAVPMSRGLRPTASDRETPDSSWEIIDVITVNGNAYVVWETSSTGARTTFCMAKIPVIGNYGGNQNLTVDMVNQKQTELVVNIANDGRKTIGIQCNLSLPEGFSLVQDTENYGITLGDATKEHSLSARLLASGDLLIVIYSKDLTALTDGTLLSIPVIAPTEATTAEGKLHEIRVADFDALNYALGDVTFAMNIASEEPEPTWHLSGPATEEEITTQSYIDGLVYNQTTKPRTITLKKGYNVIIIPSSWTTPTFGLVSDFSKRYTPFTANDLGITNPSNKKVLVLYSQADNATCYVKWGTNVVPEPEPEPEGLLTGKNYRVKNVTTGLYLQVEGNNTNMKLQNKAEGVALMQVFQLEEAAEGMYYIKAADSDNNYYAHASGWNFNATTNADNKTPFTIALVEGETQVYTLHQNVSANTGLAGSDDAAAGAAIYCDKGIDNNGKWTFEPLTEEENATYVTTLTATAKVALDAAIARGEEVVDTRSAVLTAEEVAAISGAVQAAKEGKDAATEVAALKALSDAIHTAVDAAIYVWSIDEVNSEVCYAVSTEDRGAWYAQATHLTSTTKAGVTVDVTDKLQLFAFVQSPETGALYLYSVSEEKFVKAEGGYTALTGAPEQTITILNGTRSAAFPWVVALNAEDGQKQMGVSNGYAPAVITHYNDLGDGGNTVRIEKVTTFDATAALAAIKALETGIDELKGENGKVKTALFDLSGRRVQKAQKGIFIRDGKVVVK